MTPTSDLSAAPAGTTVRGTVLAYGAVRATAETLPSLRQSPGPAVGAPLPAAFLKHADEQTVAGLAAVLQAVHAHGMAGTCFTDWGVVAASRFLGRATLAVALQRFALEGAWGVSPHLIPHHSLHSVSGTVSQALQIHGPNFGVGGGPGAGAEAMLVAGALLARNRLPGLWVVLTGWDSEPVLDLRSAPANGHKPAHRVCGAVALALEAQPAGRPGLRLEIGAGEPANRGAPVAAFSLEALLDALTEPAPFRGALPWRLGCGGWMTLDRDGAGAENAR